MGNSPHIPYTGQGRREESCGSLAHAPRPPTHAPVACVPREGEQARRTAASPSTRGQSKRCNDLVPELKDDAPLILPADRNVEECALHHGRLFSIRRANALSAEKLWKLLRQPCALGLQLQETPQSAGWFGVDDGDRSASARIVCMDYEAQAA
jgi:hypothetical protein